MAHRARHARVRVRLRHPRAGTSRSQEQQASARRLQAAVHLLPQLVLRHCLREADQPCQQDAHDPGDASRSGGHVAARRTPLSDGADHPMESSGIVTGNATWRSYHLFRAEPWEEFLCTGVRPLVDELADAGLTEGFFFIRYWERGPHIRLRLKTAYAEDVHRRVYA